MNNDQRINEMLSFWAEVYRSNPNKEFSDNQFYHRLIFQDVKREDRSISLSDQPSKDDPNYVKNYRKISPICYPNSTFNNWIQYYSDSPQTECFVSANWRYFCQFISKDNQARMAREHIKMYIPLDGNHIEKGAKMIFDFLEKNKISHLSKIGREIRFDNIVVRLINPEDAKKLIQFVSSNPYLQEGLIKPNPFAFQQNGIAMAVDGSLSFNQTVSQLLKAYMDYKRDSRSLNNVNVDEFYGFIRKLYMDQFITHRNDRLQQIMGWNPEEEKNYREVIALIIKVHNKDFTLDDYFEHYSNCSNISMLSERQITDTNRILLEALQAMTIRFRVNGIHQVKSFYETGNPTLITSKNDFRRRITSCGFRESLNAILHQRRMTFEQYAQMLLDQYHIDLDALAKQKGL